MPAGWGDDEQRFAAAVETADLTGLPLNAALRRDLQLVTMLRDTGDALSPDADASARMKARLFAAVDPEHSPMRATAVTTAEPAQARTVPVQESPEPEVSLPAMASHGRHRPDRPTRKRVRASAPTSLRRGSSRRDGDSARRRFPVVGAAATLLLVAIASMAVFLSRDALPGDTLYGVKRAAENVGLGLTFDSVEKANRHLDLAATRMGEVASLLAVPEQATDTTVLVEQALQDFDAETAAASRLLLGDVGAVDATQLNGLRDWAVEKKDALGDLRTALPTSSASDADGSLALLDRVRGRAEALDGRLLCRELSSGLTDELGILPADGLCTPLPAGIDPSQARQPGEPAGLDPGSLGLPSPKSLVPGANTNSSSPSAAAPPSGIRLPVPGVGRITIPPLLPGLPDITIGG